MRQTNLWQITLINLIASCLLTMPVTGQTTPQHLPDAVTYNNLGIKHADACRHAEAIEAYQQALSIQPHLAEAHYNLGLVYNGGQEQRRSVRAAHNA